jgi:myosin-6
MIEDHLLLMASQRVWVSSPNEGFVLGQIVDLGSDKVTVEPEFPSGHGARRPAAVSVPYEYVYPAEDNSTEDYDDNCSLMYLNEATLLNNVRLRYKRNQIYVSEVHFYLLSRSCIIGITELVKRSYLYYIVRYA